MLCAIPTEVFMRDRAHRWIELSRFVAAADARLLEFTRVAFYKDSHALLIRVVEIIVHDGREAVAAEIELGVERLGLVAPALR